MKALCRLRAAINFGDDNVTVRRSDLAVIMHDFDCAVARLRLLQDPEFTCGNLELLDKYGVVPDRVYGHDKFGRVVPETEGAIYVRMDEANAVIDNLLKKVTP